MNNSVYNKLYSLIVGKHREHHNTKYMSQFEKECIIEPDQASMITNDLLHNNVYIFPLKIGDKIYTIDSKHAIIKELEVYETGLNYFFTNPTLTEIYRYDDESKIWFKDKKQAENIVNTLRKIKDDINKLNQYLKKED